MSRGKRKKNQNHSHLKNEKLNWRALATVWNETKMICDH